MSGETRFQAKAGTVLFRPGDECTGFITIHSGSVRVSLNAVSGREIVLYRVTPGQVCMQTFACLTQGRLYGAEAVAESDCDISTLPPSAFEARMLDDPAFRSNVFGAIADRFADFEHTVQALAFSGLEARVADILLRLANEAGDVAATHERLATEIGSAREAVSRQLGVMARQGLVELSRGHVRITNRNALLQLAAGLV